VVFSATLTQGYVFVLHLPKNSCIFPNAKKSIEGVGFMFQRSLKCYFSAWMLYGVTIGLLSLNAAQASSLNTLRLGVNPQKTRLVFELDRTTPYQVDFDETSVRVTFDALSVTPEVVNNFRNGLGGLLDKIDYATDGGKTTFTLNVKDRFYLRYFDLVSPTRVVVDFYPREEEPEFADKTTPPATAPASPVAEPSNREIVSQEPSLPLASTPVEQSETSDSAEIASKAVESASEPALGGTDAGPTPGATPQPINNPAELKKNRGRSNVIIFGALAVAGLLALTVLILRRKTSKKVEVQPHPEVKTEAPVVPELHIEFAESETVAEVQPHYQAAHEQNAIGERPPEWSEEEIQPAETPPEENKISETDLRDVKEELFDKPDDAPALQEPDTGDVSELIPTESAADSGISTETEEPLPGETEIQPEIPQTEEKSEMSAELEGFLIPEAVGDAEKPETIADERASEVPVSQHQVSVENAIPELRIEDGTLIWPVHLLDGGRSGRILVVDDEADIVKPIEEYLTSQGYEVLGSTNSAAALEKYADWHPDLIILDVAMPKLSGVDFVKEIRKEEKHRKVIFLSGKTERDTVEAAFAPELQSGLYEFFKKPVLLEQIGGRVKDYFLAAQEVLHLNLTDQLSFSETIDHLSPHQLVALHSFLWDRIFEVSAELLGRRIEPFFITDRMEPATEYMRRMGCQERRDYCIARVCIVSNPLCASNRLRAELEIMRQILHEFREEYLVRIHRGVVLDEPEAPPPRKKRAPKKPRKKELVEVEDAAVAAPPRKTVKKGVATRRR
jgi:CheY-like chemotaxis protein